MFDSGAWFVGQFGLSYVSKFKACLCHDAIVFLDTCFDMRRISTFDGCQCHVAIVSWMGV